MRKKLEIQEILKDLIIQYGVPADSNIKLYTSIIKTTLVDSPEEEKLIQMSLSEKIPLLLDENGENSLYVNNLIEEFSTKNQIDIQSAKWLVTLWADAMGIQIDQSSNLRENNHQSLNYGEKTPEDVVSSLNASSEKPIPTSLILESVTIICQNCGKEFAEGTKFCKYCGSKISIANEPVIVTIGNICQNCGKEFAEGTKFCKYCGSKISIANELVIETIGNICQNCGKELEVNAKFCKFCGSKRILANEPTIETTENICPNCGKELEENAKFCKFCGSKISIANEPFIETIGNICQNCGKEFAEGTKFCKFCGSKVSLANEPVIETIGNICQN